MEFSNLVFTQGGQAAPLPEDEPQRLIYVRECGILDTPDEESFNRLTRLTAILCGVPIAGISVIDDHRQWIKSRYGPLERESAREISFCSYALLSDHLFIVPDAHKDERFRTNPLVQGPPHIRFYAGAPLISSVGYRLGALFIVDTQPNSLTEINRRILRDFAAIAVDLVENKSKWL
jgi:GAF domain-containing protein